MTGVKSRPVILHGVVSPETRGIYQGAYPVIDSGLVGEVSRGEKMLKSGTDPESYTTEYTLVYEENPEPRNQGA